jgi:hypothetical protein
VTDAEQDASPSPALARFQALVRERRSLVRRKERSDWQMTYEVCTIRQLLEQVSAELAAGIKHDPVEVNALIARSGEMVEARRTQQAARKPQRFRGIGR